LGAEQPVYGLEADLDLARAPETLEALAAKYIEAIKAHQRQGPYHLLGFSLGSFTAYEMAVQLRRRGDRVGLLCVFDTPPGDVLSRGDKLLVAAQRAAFRLRTLRGASGAQTREYLERLGREALRRVRSRLGNGEDAEGAVAGHFKTVVDRNRQAALVYAQGPMPRFDGKVTVILAKSTSMDAVSDSIDPRLAWRRFADGGVESHRVPGNHLSMLDPPDVEALGATLRRVIERAQSEA
jgi:thioesterase domain-containing protein